jgi:hypothetical protein
MSIDIEKDKYLLDLGYEILDLGLMTNHDWDRIAYIAKQALKCKVTSEVSKAYIVAFVIYVSQRIEMSIPFDPKFDHQN